MYVIVCTHGYIPVLVCIDMCMGVCLYVNTNIHPYIHMHSQYIRTHTYISDFKDDKDIAYRPI